MRFWLAIFALGIVYQITIADSHDRNLKVKNSTSADKDEIYKKMVPPPILLPENPAPLQVGATCTDDRLITRDSSDPLYRGCLERKPAWYQSYPPASSNTPGQTTFGLRISK